MTGQDVEKLFFLLGKQRALVRFFSGLLSNKIFPFLQEMPQAPIDNVQRNKKAMTKRCTFGGIQYQTVFFQSGDSLCSKIPWRNTIKGATTTQGTKMDSPP